MDLTLHHLREDRFAIDNRAVLQLAAEPADIACAARRLCPRQFVHDVISSLPACHVAGLLIHAHQRREIMPQRVSGDRVALPSAVDLPFWRQACILHEVVQQAIGAETQQKTAIHLDRRCKIRGQQPYRR